MFPTGRQRILRSTAATLSWQPLDSDGETTTVDPGTVTVGVVASDGSTVVAAGTATSGSGAAARTYDLTPAQTADLDVLTATWTAAGTVLAVTTHDVVGGFYCRTDDIRDREPSTSNGTRDPKDALVLVRNEVECMIESACGGSSFVPRFSTWTHRVCGDSVALPVMWLRAVRWLRVWSDNTSSTSLSDTDCAAIPASPAGVVSLPYQMAGRVELGFEHGLDAPPLDLRRAALAAMRDAQQAPRSGIPARATSLQLADGSSAAFATPGRSKSPGARDRWVTGIPAIDEVLERYSVTAARGIA